MKYIVSVLCGLMFADISSLAASFCPPPILWQVSYGSWAGERVMSVRETHDRGFIAGGWSNGPADKDKQSPHYGSDDYWIVRLDANGVKLWDASFGGSSADYLEVLRETSDGGSIMVGDSWSEPSGNKTSSYTRDGRAWMVRADSQGNKLWERSFHTYGYHTALEETADQGFIFLGNPGSTDVNVWVQRLDRNGDKLWETYLGGQGADFASAVKVLPDGGFIIAATSSSEPGGSKTSPFFGGDDYGDYWIIRLRADGTKVWDKSFGGSDREYARELELTPDGGCLVAGLSWSPADGNKTSPYGHMWLVRLDANGEKLWEKVYGNRHWYEGLDSLAALADGGFIFGGQVLRPGVALGLWDYQVMRIDAAGDLFWSNLFSGERQEWSGDMHAASDGGVILGIVSERPSDFWIFKLGPELMPDCDSDGDGVPNSRDACPYSPAGALVDAEGCSLEERCPCYGFWRDHVEYVECVQDAAKRLQRNKVISPHERRELIRRAEESLCGNP